MALARLSSWLIRALFYTTFLLSIYPFSVLLPPIRLEILQGLFELPPAEYFALARSWIFQKPLPDSWRGPYKYLPSSNWIRLCRIERTENDGLYIVLERYLLDRAPPYRALSYTWGPAEGRNVPHARNRLDWLVHGRNRSLPANLVTALINLSDRDLSGYYWIDALCIDQLNHKERNEQVMIMDKIFRHATAVNVWLGKAYSDTQEINRIIEDLVNHQEQEEKLPTRPTWSTGADLMLPSDWDTLVQIFSGDGSTASGRCKSLSWPRK